jgi:hypothetical protein
MLQKREWGRPGDLVTLEESKIIASRCVISSHLIDIDEKKAFMHGETEVPVKDIQGRVVHKHWFDVHSLELDSEKFTNCIIYIATGEIFSRINEG